MTYRFERIDPQTVGCHYEEWNSKHEYKDGVALEIDHRGDLWISVNDNYGVRLNAKTLYETLKEYFEK